MQKRLAPARAKPADSQRRLAARSGQTQLVVAPTSTGEVTLGGLADRGLTLAALYETGVLERLRFEVRARLLADLTVSLAWLHANPRLMAAQGHLLIAPSTVVIGLDGVARVDVRAAKKARSEWSEVEAGYAAPELTLPGAAVDHRADIYSLGMLTWEALAGRRLHEAPFAAPRSIAAPADDDGDDALPATLAGPARLEREPARRKPAAAARAPKGSHARLRLAPPPLTLPEDAEWALPLLELALAALNLDVGLRPQDCRSVLARLESITSRLAAHQEIAEVVQGITAASTLCIPEPTLPGVDALCQQVNGARSVGHLPCSEQPSSCFQVSRALPERVHILHPFEPPAEPAPAPSAVPAPAAAAPARAAQPLQVWFGVALLWLATLGLLAGYASSVLAHR